MECKFHIEEQVVDKCILCYAPICSKCKAICAEFGYESLCPKCLCLIGCGCDCNISDLNLLIE